MNQEEKDKKVIEAHQEVTKMVIDGNISQEFGKKVLEEHLRCLDLDQVNTIFQIKHRLIANGASPKEENGF